MDNFLKFMENKQAPVHLQVAAALQEWAAKNSKILETIIETVLLCGRQNIPLRGHRDDAKHSEDANIKTGNFKALLQYRVNGWETYLGHHIENDPKNTTYMSKTTQNEIISLIGEKIQQQIIEDCCNIS